MPVWCGGNTVKGVEKKIIIVIYFEREKNIFKQNKVINFKKFLRIKFHKHH